jgi:N-glycosylase/DNA lyase
MMQVGAVFLGKFSFQIELPHEDEELLPGIKWGSLETFPTPAYWAYQVFARRLKANQVQSRLGATFKEEVAACLLGGHGIPSSVGLAAFQQLKAVGLLNSRPSQEEVHSHLSKPIDLNGQLIRYRFARQKAKYLSAALEVLDSHSIDGIAARDLRDWLVLIPGIGMKTASWIVRNWLGSDDVAILDIHVLRAGKIAGFLKRGLTVERHYLELENQFLDFSRALGVRASELDAVIWYEMASSPSAVREVISYLNGEAPPIAGRRKHQHKPRPRQKELFHKPAG